jgi:hypothetical protein
MQNRAAASDRHDAGARVEPVRLIPPDRAVWVHKDPKLLKQFLATIRSVTSVLVAVIGRETEKNNVSDGVERDWTAEEDADFLNFCASIDVPPTCRELALAMQDGEIDFFNNDIFVGVKLYRA